MANERKLNSTKVEFIIEQTILDFFNEIGELVHKGKLAFDEGRKLEAPITYKDILQGETKDVLRLAKSTTFYNSGILMGSYIHCDDVIHPNQESFDKMHEVIKSLWSNKLIIDEWTYGRYFERVSSYLEILQSDWAETAGAHRIKKNEEDSQC